jgi:hypothetical protein
MLIFPFDPHFREGRLSTQSKSIIHFNNFTKELRKGSDGEKSGLRKMKNDRIINKFSKHLFWDVDRDTLDLEQDKAYIIKNVLEYGLIEDWKVIKESYGISVITREAMSFRNLDKKALSFISNISKTPKEDFRCYNYQQSIPPHWNF